MFTERTETHAWRISHQNAEDVALFACNCRLAFTSYDEICEYPALNGIKVALQLPRDARRYRWVGFHGKRFLPCLSLLQTCTCSFIRWFIGHENKEILLVNSSLLFSVFNFFILLYKSEIYTILSCWQMSTLDSNFNEKVKIIRLFIEKTKFK